MAIAHVETNTDASNTATSTISGHTVSGSNPVLVVKVATRETTPNQVTGVMWNTDEALAKLNSDINGNAGVEIWYLKAPTATTADVVISMSESNRCVSAASTYSGVDQNNPFRVAANASANGTNDAPTVDVTALDTEMVVDSLCQVSGGPDTAAAAHTQRHNTAATGGGTDTRGASQEKASSGAVETMSWTMSDSDNWAIAAGALQGVQPATYDKEFSVDAVLKKSDNDKEFSADAFLQKKDIDKEFSVDARITLVGDNEFSVDAILKKSDNDKEFSTDALLQVVDNDVDFTVDALLQVKDNDKEFSVDALLQTPDQDKEFSADALLQSKDNDKEFSVDAILEAAGATYDKTFTADAILKKSDIDKEFTVDAILEAAGVVTYDKTLTVDAILKATLEKTFTVDAILGAGIDRRGGGIIRKRTFKEYEFDIFVPVLRESKTGKDVFCPVKVSREKQVEIHSGVQKYSEKSINMSSKINYRKLFEILDNI